MSDDEASNDADEAITEAVGKASEALEYVERARGHLYSFHQLMGHADLVFGEAVDQFRDAGLDEVADHLDEEVVGRNVLDGRWTFQIVEEFDDLYHQVVTREVRSLEERFHDGERHVFESNMKERRRTKGKPGHESRPATAHDPRVDTEERPHDRS
jgi:hypothetical protein